MRGLLLILSAAMIAGAAWAAIDAREDESTARIRHTACIQRYGFSEARCPYERRWDVDRLLIAAVLGAGGVVSLALSELTRRRA